MKFSIAWIFEHLACDWHLQDIPSLVATFNRVTAEIEHVRVLEHNLDAYSVAQVVTADAEQVVVHSPEWDHQITLNAREGAAVGQWFLVKKISTGYRWALVNDLGAEKEGALCELFVEPGCEAGAWKRSIVAKDYIIEVDNKSITHRPDLWGHRGMAREIGAFLSIPLKPLEPLLHPITINEHESRVTSHDAIPLTLQGSALPGCSRIAATQCVEVTTRPTAIAMAFRLAAIDSRPINSVVDLTNFVMVDLGSPMHAFDADSLATNTLEIRYAQHQEKLLLLDGEQVALADRDVVITNGERAVSLAGIMGGKESGVSLATKRLVLEAGCFDAATIRHTAARVKKRTDASARFEKSLDATLPILAIRRFLAAAVDSGVTMRLSPELLVLGAAPAQRVITLQHAFIEGRLGVSLSNELVCRILKALEFGVTLSNNLEYTIQVPPFRATKDIAIAEDIVEEIARFYGYNTIIPTLPQQTLKPWDLKPLQRVRLLKKLYAYGLCMQEVYNYALYDEEFLRQFGWEPAEYAQVKSPVSEHWRRLVTSLTPHLIKTVVQNMQHHDQLRFFEWGRVWHQHADTITEKRVLAAIIADQKQELDFYTVKQEVERVCAVLGIKPHYQRIDETLEPWVAPYESAYILHNEQCIGKIIKIDTTFYNRLVPGSAFVVEFDGDYIVQMQEPRRVFSPLSKYPDVVRDISMLVPRSVMVEQVERLVRAASPLITQVALTDFLLLEQYPDKKALTVRFVLQDHQKTLTKEEVDVYTAAVLKQLATIGAEIR